MSRIGLLAAGTAAYLVTLFASAPAELIRGPLEALQPAVRLGPLHGHPLAGNASQARLGELPVEGLAWRWHPGALGDGRLAFAVELVPGPTTVSLEARVSPSGQLDLAGITGELDLAWLGEALPAAALRASGRIVADDVALRLDHDGWPRAASGNLRLHDVALQAPFTLRIGGAEAVLAIRESRLEIDFTLEPGGPIEGAGVLRLTADGAFAFEARLAPGAEADAMTRELLRSLGAVRPGEPTQVALNGSWR